MADEEIGVRLRLKDQARFRQGLKGAGRDIDGLGGAARRAGSAMRNELGRTANQTLKTLKYGAIAAGAATTALGVNVVRTGVKLNAQWQDLNSSFTTLLGSRREAKEFVETMRGMTDATPFRLTEALDAARQLIGAGMGTGGVRDTLEAVRNAAMVSGGDPSEKFARMSEILGVIQARGKVSAEELARFDALGMPIRKGLQRELGLTADEVANIGKQGVSSRRFMKAFIKMMTTGDMAKAAKNAEDNFNVQTQTLVKRWEQIQRLATEGLFTGLNKDLMPALLDTSSEITKLLERDDLTLKQKIDLSWDIAKANLGPVVDDLRRQIDDADLGGKLAEAVEWGVPKIAEAAAKAAPKAVTAFYNAWREMGLWGKLLTAGFLAKKLGLLALFGSLARSSATHFVTGWRSKGNQRKFRGAGRFAGRAIGAGMLAGIAASSVDPDAATGDRAAQFVDGLLLGLPGGLVRVITGEDPVWERPKGDPYERALEDPTNPYARSQENVRKVGPGRFVHEGKPMYTGVPGRAHGGLVGGHGIGDTQLRRLDPREFVMSPRAVDRIGVRTLEQLNRGVMPRRHTPQVQVEAVQPIVLHLDGRQVAETVARINLRVAGA